MATINNLSPQADNILSIQFVGLTGSLGYLNDMQIEAIAPAGTAGDYNNNGSADAADYVTWRDSTGTTNALPNDPLGGTIGQGQYGNWRARFGEIAPAAGQSVGAVPESHTVGLLLAAVFVHVMRRRSIQSCAW